MDSPRSLQCAKQYVNEAAAVVGEQYKHIMFEKMTRQIIGKQFDNQHTTPVLNLGPGSTGTQSVFTAMRMLNITAKHYTQISYNCRNEPSERYRKEFGDRLEPLAGMLLLW